MAQLTITYPDGMAQRIVNGFSAAHNYQAQIRDVSNQLIDNPESKAQFVKRKIIEFIRESWRAGELEEVKRQAAATVVDIDITDIT